MLRRDALRYRAIPLPDRITMADTDMREAAQAFYARMKSRHTIREFTDRAVSREIIEWAIRTAGTAPSGANHQPWHFVAVSDPSIKAHIRDKAEEEERRFYAGGGGDEWIKALEPMGTNAEKSHLTVAPWLIVVFAQRWGEFKNGERFKNYYVPESTNIAIGFLLAALHHAGLCMLTHTPNPMKFLAPVLGRPASEKPAMIIAVGHPAEDATVPAAAKLKKPIREISTFLS
ncbi:MAG: nitroreductase family protein [Rhodobacteraceae bacterium]|nr:nitroreductase family protein [Paracoccaceae bacterium]MCY4195454.1 nitroreductase family protein [Paracoccaceae bacterium]